MTWYHSPMVAFDLETDTSDSKQARIVSGYGGAVTGNPLAEVNTWGGVEWLIDPGVEISEDAVKIHGITTEHARAHGMDPVEGIRGIQRHLVELATDGGRQLGLKLDGPWDSPESLDALANAVSSRDEMVTTWPIVGMNIAYDLTVLHRDALRHGVTPWRDLCERLKISTPCVDVYVIDRKIDQYRDAFLPSGGKNASQPRVGLRNLASLCRVYGVRHDKAHDAAGDALAAARVAVRLGRLSPYLAGLSTERLHELQIEWRRTQCANTQASLRRLGRRNAVVDPCWPICLPEAHPEECTQEGLFSVDA